MNEPIRRLPDTELEVMQAVWNCTPPVSKSDIESIVYTSHPMAETTLQTLLTRLSEKGFIKIEKVSRSARYYPLVSQQEYLAQQSKNFLQRLCGGNMSTFATALCDSGISKEDLAELRELLDKELL